MKCVKAWTGDLGLPRAFSLPHTESISVSQQLSTNQKQVGKFSHLSDDMTKETANYDMMSSSNLLHFLTLQADSMCEGVSSKPSY